MTHAAEVVTPGDIVIIERTDGVEVAGVIKYVGDHGIAISTDLGRKVLAWHEVRSIERETDCAGACSAKGES